MKNYTLITGCTSGIGRSLSFVFANNKHNLVLVSKDINKLNNLKEELLQKYDIDIFVIEKNLLLDSASKEIYDTLVSNKLNVDVLINNAGIGMYGEFLETDINKINDVIKLNINALVELTYFIGKFFKAKKEGTIINIASTGAFVPGPYMSCYYASKAFVLSFSEALLMELKEYNVHVCCVCPGPTKTDFFDKSCDYKYNLLKTIKSMDSDKVAQLIYKSYIKKKSVSVIGFKNKLAVFFNRFISRNLSRKIIYKIQNNRRNKY